MVHSYTGLILGEGLLLEDEIGVGLILNEMYNSRMFTFFISMASLTISYICLNINIRQFKVKFPELYISWVHFITLFGTAGIISVLLANYLDRFVRINWVR